jgi:hypothetical protein
MNKCVHFHTLDTSDFPQLPGFHSSICTEDVTLLIKQEYDLQEGIDRGFPLQLYLLNPIQTLHDQRLSLLASRDMPDVALNHFLTPTRYALLTNSVSTCRPSLVSIDKSLWSTYLGFALWHRASS